MKLVGQRGTTLLFEKEDGTAFIQHVKYGDIDTSQSVQAVLARGYWTDPITKHMGPGPHKSGSDQSVHDDPISGGKVNKLPGTVDIKKPQKRRRIRRLIKPTTMADIVKHAGPGPHPSGSSQDVHGRKFSGVPSVTELRRINTERLARVGVRAGIDDDPFIVENGQRRFEFALENTASITADLVPVARELDGKLVLLQERVKYEESIRRKIKLIQLDKGLPPAEAVNDVTDLNRYTLQFEADERFVPSVQRTVEALETAGYRLVPGKDKNFWAPGDAYDGYNFKFETPSGTFVEIQFHTPGSSELLQKGHVLFNQSRMLPTDDPEYHRLNQEMIDLWNRDRSHVPPGWENYGTLVVNVGKRRVIVKTLFRYFMWEGVVSSLLYRVDDRFKVEVWGDGQWRPAAMVYGTLIGIGGDSDYSEITPQRASQFQQEGT